MYSTTQSDIFCFNGTLFYRNILVWCSLIYFCFCFHRHLCHQAEPQGLDIFPFLLLFNWNKAKLIIWDQRKWRYWRLKSRANNCQLEEKNEPTEVSLIKTWILFKRFARSILSNHFHRSHLQLPPHWKLGSTYKFQK